jgi:LytS/YehU family sensor histidine kinase
MFVSQFEDAQLLIFVIVYLLGTFTLKMSKSWFILQRVNHRLSMIEKEKLSNQLKSLKSQVNPHFLFNSLNVIYSLALKNSDKTKEAILKLSDVLRYVIYDSSKDLVNIESEIKLIQDFIDLQKFRTDNFNNIKFEHQIENNLSISPLILLPLVENSFKHGINSGIEHTFLRINLKTIKTKLLFTIENNLNSELKKEIGGFGLNNIEERLKLLYPSNHKFCRFDNENSFKIEIKIWNLKA